MGQHLSHNGPIFLIGYMASGKTTFGRALACATGRRFVDLDEKIETDRGLTVSQIFALEGEAAFRDLESKTLAALGADSDLIVACGGGTPCFGRNMDLMLDSGLTVWLDAPVDVLTRRLLAARDKRPLVAKIADPDELRDFVTLNLDRRSPHYSRAHVRFDSSRLETKQEIADSITKFLQMI